MCPDQLNSIIRVIEYINISKKDCVGQLKSWSHEGQQKDRETSAACVHLGRAWKEWSSLMGKTIPGSAKSFLQATTANDYILRFCNTLYDSSMLAIWLPT